MQQPQSRPLLGDSVSSASSPQGPHRNSQVAVLTHQQLQQLQLQAQSTSGQQLAFTLQQAAASASNNATGTDQQGNTTSSTTSHIVYVNQQGAALHPGGGGMGLSPATPTFGVAGLNMGLPLSLLNTSLSSLTSNVITTSNPLLNLSLPGLTAINQNLGSIGGTINSNINSEGNSINNSLSSLTGQELGISRLNALNASELSINQNLSALNTRIQNATTGAPAQLSNLNATINANLVNNEARTQIPFQAIHGIEGLLGSNIVPTSVISQIPSSTITSQR